MEIKIISNKILVFLPLTRRKLATSVELYPTHTSASLRKYSANTKGNPIGISEN